MDSSGVTVRIEDDIVDGYGVSIELALRTYGFKARETMDYAIRLVKTDPPRLAVTIQEPEFVSLVREQRNHVASTNVIADPVKSISICFSYLAPRIVSWKNASRQDDIREPSVRVMKQCSTNQLGAHTVGDQMGL
jgi:hypothetical protein